MRCPPAGQGDMLAALHKSAEKAIRLVPSVFFLDEIDSFYRRDRPGSGYILGVVNGLLTLLDRLIEDLDHISRDAAILH